MPALRLPSRTKLALLYLIVVGVWGTTWLAIKSAVDTIPPVTASGLRFAIASPLLMLIAARAAKVPLRYPPGHRRLLATVTLAYFTLPFALMNLGSAIIPSGLAAVLFASVALFIMAFSVPLLGTRITRRQAFAVASSMAALAALIAIQTGVGGEARPLGVLALLAAAILHALVYVLLKRDAGAISPLTLNALPMGLAALLLCGAGLVFEHPELGAISASSWLSTLYLGSIASVAGVLAYFHLLKHLSPIALSLVFVLFPAVAQVAAVLAGERAMHGISLLLLACILGSSLLALTNQPGPPDQASPVRSRTGGPIASPAS